MRSTRCSRRTREAQSCQPIFVCHTALLPHTNRLQEEHKNYEIDSSDDKKDQKNPVEKRSSRKGPFPLRLAESNCVRNGLKVYCSTGQSKGEPKRFSHDPIASLISPQSTHPHTSTHPYRVPQKSIPQQRREAGLVANAVATLLAAS